jgi:hypothetical protein
MILTDLHGKIRMICDTENVTLLEDMDRSKIQLLPPDLNKLLEHHFRRVAALYGIESMNVKDRVSFYQRTFFVKKDTMLWWARSGAVKGFPLTEKQILENWEENCPCYIMGHLKKRKVSARQFQSNEERDILESCDKRALKGAKKGRTIATDGEASETPEVLSAIPLQGVERRNLKIFEEVGTDIKGPYHGATIVTFVDKATGKKFMVLVKSKEALAPAFEEFLSMIKKHGYTVNTFRSDSEAVYKTKEVEAVLKKYDVKEHVFSPRYQKEYNGLAEAGMQPVQNCVTSIFSCQQHAPEGFWPGA